jgi:prepilin-type N-terminal cleavage/methylation domain-containing protein
MHHRLGFTLIELLVVVTIIVILLALLAPAMDKAIYEAEMVVCQANLRGVATGASMYTADQKRFYPHRQLGEERPTNLSGSSSRPARWLTPARLLCRTSV